MGSEGERGGREGEESGDGGEKGEGGGREGKRAVGTRMRPGVSTAVITVAGSHPVNDAG